jgi:hypothetical protein
LECQYAYSGIKVTACLDNSKLAEGNFNITIPYKASYIASNGYISAETSGKLKFDFTTGINKTSYTVKPKEGDRSINTIQV